ncbi:hypothetical protein [Psychroserpens algicola]|uniref:hypothetical protein n=1 Tax=Psychroserpens algicola TaxID=1719034 RepID=UPI0019538C47|nr:hypothetical protein [Psychroserpens algicola]
MSAPKFKATMTIPKNGMEEWNDIMQNPPKTLPQGINEDNYIVASCAKFSDGVTVFGGVAVGAKSQDFNYPLFMVFDKNMHQVGGWPIDTSDWDSWSARSIQFAVDPNDEDGNYLLDIVEATS